MLCLDSTTIRDALKEVHTRKETLTQERTELKKSIKLAEKQAKEDAKAGPAAGTPAASRLVGTRSKPPPNPLLKMVEDQERVLEVSLGGFFACCVIH